MAPSVRVPAIETSTTPCATTTLTCILFSSFRRPLSVPVSPACTCKFHSCPPCPSFMLPPCHTPSLPPALSFFRSLSLSLSLSLSCSLSLFSSLSPSLSLSLSLSLFLSLSLVLATFQCFKFSGRQRTLSSSRRLHFQIQS